MENDESRSDYIHPFNDPNRGAIVLAPLGEGLKSFVASTVSIFAIGSGIYMLGGHLLCKAKLIKNYTTVPLGTAINNQLKDKWMWGISAVGGLFSGLTEHRTITSVNRQQLDLIRENHTLRAERDQANAALTTTASEPVLSQQTLEPSSAEPSPLTNHAAKLTAPVENHAAQALMDKAAAAEAAPTIH